MKSFGVRLGAGIVTILFGAYAAALAQKDKQNDPGSWTAQAPTLGEPAAPIAGMGDESWITQPSSDSVNSLADFAGTAFSNASVALVQHTEDSTLAAEVSVAEANPGFDMSRLPSSLGQPQSVPENESTLAADIPDWANAAASLPAAVDAARDAVSQFATSPDAASVERSLSMNFPSESPAAQPAPSEPSAPEFALAQPPAMDITPHQPQPAPTQPQPNDLRGSAMDQNALRSLAVPGQDSGLAPAQLAQESSAFTQPPRFEQPQLQQQPDPIRSLPLAPQQRPAAEQPQRFASLPRPGLTPRLQPNLAPSISVNETNDPSGALDSPGERRLEGMQSPSVMIHKRAPAEVKVGKPASFVIQVQNVGASEALNVKVHDRVPSGMRLVDASPAPSQQGNLLTWELGSLPAGDERTVTMQLVPEAEGELGSVARVTFEAAASVRTVSTRPELKIVQRAPAKVLIGQQLEIELEVSNPGTGEAANVSLQEDVPEGLEHPRGRQLDNLIGTLAPGEVRHQVLRLRAVSPGVIANTIRLVSEDGLTAEHSIDVEVIAPQLKVELAGPSRRFLERQATYQVNIANVGTADATNVEVSVGLDRGFNFVSTDYEGQYDPSRHAVYWSLDSLPAGDSGSVPLTLLPVQEGQRALTVDARADLNTTDRAEHLVTVEGFAELSFQIVNPGGPIELGAESDYVITVNNSGSKTDANVRLQVQLPAGLTLVSADGDGGQANTDGRGTVVFPPRNQLAAGDEAKYRMRVRGVAPGTHLVKAVVVSDGATVPVTKEESTLVYADQ